MVLIRTRVGRYILLVVLAVGALAVVKPGFVPGAESATSVRNQHRPPVSAQHAHFVTLTVVWGARNKPSEITWAIGKVLQDVNMGMVQDVPPVFKQTLQYDPRQRYEISAYVAYPGGCSIDIDGVTIQPDWVKRGTNGEALVHCWVDPV